MLRALRPPAMSRSDSRPLGINAQANLPCLPVETRPQVGLALTPDGEPVGDQLLQHPAHWTKKLLGASAIYAPRQSIEIQHFVEHGPVGGNPYFKIAVHDAKALSELGKFYWG
jgi:hypothetical protein